MISFAQNLEDVLISRFFHGDDPQFYVDVGAAHHSYHSVTKHFYDGGWRGLNIEPRTHLWELLQAHRPEDQNVQCCVSDKAGAMKFFEVTSPTYTGTDAGGLSTLDASKIDGYLEQNYEVVEKELPVATLSDLLSQRDISDIGFLKIDVEGFEYQVVKGLDLSRWRPRLIIAECTTPMTDVLCDNQVNEHLQNQGYTPEYYDGLNRFFVRTEDAERASRLKIPVNVADGFVRAEELELRDMVHCYKTQIAELTAKCNISEDRNRVQRAAIVQLEKKLHQLMRKTLRQRIKELPGVSRMANRLGLNMNPTDVSAEPDGSDAKSRKAA